MLSTACSPQEDNSDKEAAGVMASKAFSKLGCCHYLIKEGAVEKTLGEAPAMQV